MENRKSLEKTVNVPNLIADGVTPEMVKKTEQKFKQFDMMVQNNWIEGTQEQQKLFYDALKDPTIYAYAFFKNPKNVNQPLKLRAYQDLLINDMNRFVLFVASNQCIYENERVYLAKGKDVAIKDIKEGDLVLTHKEGQLINKKVTWKSEPILKPCYQLKTRCGKKLILSEDHPLLTPSGYKSIKEGLKKYNYRKFKSMVECSSMVCIPKSLNNFGEEEISREEIITLAYMMTDGYFGNDTQTPKFTNKSKKLLNEFEEVVRFFGVEPKWYPKGGGYDIIASSGREYNRRNFLTLYLKKHNLWCSKNQRKIPELLKNLNKSCLKLFINRIYAADGTIFKFKTKQGDRTRIMFYSPCKDFIEDLQIILLRFGVHSNIIIENPNSTNDATQKGYRLTCQNPKDILKFFEEFGFIFDKEQQCVESLEICKKQLEQFVDLRDKLDNEDFFWDYITSIEYVGGKICYDIGVEETHNFIVNGIVAHNCGKSITLDIKSLCFALQNPGTTTIIWSKNMDLSKDRLRSIKGFLQHSTLDYKYSVGDTDNKTQIEFKHFDIQIDKEGNEKVKELPDSRIICAPATTGSVSYPADLALLDELAFYEDGEYFYEQVALPRTFATKGQIIGFSNPNGAQGIFWKIWQSPIFNKYRFNFFDNPENTQQDFDLVSTGLSQERIDSTLLAIFTSPEGAFLSVEEKKALFEERSNMLPYKIETPLYTFFDFAKSHDQTVRSIGSPIYENGEVVGVDVFETLAYPLGTGYDEIIDDYIGLIEEVGADKFYMVGWDNTGVGRGIEDFITKVAKFGIMCEPVEFSLQNKSAMYTMFKFLVEQNLKGKRAVKLPFIEESEKQFSKLRFKKTSRGYLQVHHETENDRDDYCFIAGTLILTDKGQIPIEQLKIGDKVMTRKGFKKIQGINNRMAKVITRFGLTGTPNHPFITTKGIKTFDTVNVLDKLYLWDEKQLNIMEKNIIDIQTPKEDIFKYIIGDIHLGKNPLKHCIEIFGKKQTEKFLKDMLFITKMEIPLIIFLIILKQCLEENINLNINLPKKENEFLAKIYKNMQDPKQSNGINLKKVENGIKSILKILCKTVKNINIFVLNAKKNMSQQDLNILSIVQKNVGGEHLQEEKDKKEYQVVYNLSIENCPEYFANNILVHNCDSVVGLCSLIINPDSPPITLEIVSDKSKTTFDSDKCECGNILDIGDVNCSFCGKELDVMDGIV